ncbi:MAG: hypothetical protein ACRDHZ_12950 [Ktedonobacteraceae bacterium]
MSHRNQKNKQARSWRMRKQAQPAPARATDQPFCAYLGPQGETCASTTDLQTVLSLEGPPTLVWMACSQHRAEVHQLALAFVQRSQTNPQTLTFNYHDSISQVQVRVQKKIVDS